MKAPGVECLSFKIFENQSSTCWCQNPINQGKLQKNPLRKPLEVTQDWITCDCLQFSLPSWWKDVLGCLLSKDDLHRNSLVLGVFSIDWRSLMIDTKASIDNLHSFLSYSCRIVFQSEFHWRWNVLLRLQRDMLSPLKNAIKFWMLKKLGFWLFRY